MRVKYKPCTRNKYETLFLWMYCSETKVHNLKQYSAGGQFVSDKHEETFRIALFHSFVITNLGQS